MIEREIDRAVGRYENRGGGRRAAIEGHLINMFCFYRNFRW